MITNLDHLLKVLSIFGHFLFDLILRFSFSKLVEKNLVQSFDAAMDYNSHRSVEILWDQTFFCRYDFEISWFEFASELCFEVTVIWTDFEIWFFVLILHFGVWLDCDINLFWFFFSKTFIWGFFVSGFVISVLAKNFVQDFNFIIPLLSLNFYFCKILCASFIRKLQPLMVYWPCEKG